MLQQNEGGPVSIYEYEHTETECFLGKMFEVMQRMSDEPLKREKPACVS